LGHCIFFVFFTSPSPGLIVAPSGLDFIAADGTTHRPPPGLLAVPSAVGAARCTILELVLLRLRLALL
jgi:hypothetical protein